MLIAVPLYISRRPGTQAPPAAVASTSASASAGGPIVLPKPSASAGAAVTAVERLKLGAVQKVRCGASAANAKTEGSLCDTLGFFEEALKNAVRETESCAPKQSEPGSINYVLTIDFPRRKLHAYPGASGSWRGEQARRASQCVARAIKVPDWNAISHQYRFYAIAVLATYGAPSAPAPASSAIGAPGLPNFD
jgi:hypothetical protein